MLDDGCFLKNIWRQIPAFATRFFSKNSSSKPSFQNF
jgi:hypothetical protein